MAVKIISRACVFSGSDWNVMLRPPEGWVVVKVRERPGELVKAYIRSEYGRGKDFAECFIYADTGELLVRSKNSRPSK